MDNVKEPIRELTGRIEALEKAAPLDKLSMIVFSGSLDKMIAAFIIATGAAAMGSEVSMFFTFWGTAALRKKGQGKEGLHFQDVRFHASHRFRPAEAVKDEHGRGGHRHDEVPHEKEEDREPA